MAFLRIADLSKIRTRDTDTGQKLYHFLIRQKRYYVLIGETITKAIPCFSDGANGPSRTTIPVEPEFRLRPATLKSKGKPENENHHRHHRPRRRRRIRGHGHPISRRYSFGYPCAVAVRSAGWTAALRTGAASTLPAKTARCQAKVLKGLLRRVFNRTTICAVCRCMSFGARGSP